MHEVPGTRAQLYLLDGSGVFVGSQPLFKVQQGGAAGQPEELEELRRALEDATRQNQELVAAVVEEEQHTTEGLRGEIQELGVSLQQMTEALETEMQRATEAKESTIGKPASANDELEQVTASLQAEKERVRQIWLLNCQQLVDYDEVIATKDCEIAELTAQLKPRTTTQFDAEREDGDHRSSPGYSRAPICSRTTPSRMDPLAPTCTPSESLKEGVAGTRRTQETGLGKRQDPTHTTAVKRHGRAPPIDSFTGEDPEMRLDDWLPSLQRASQWNQWSESEQVIQLAGHLCGRALQEWNLLENDGANSFAKMVQALRNRLEPQTRALAAQDFRHTSQGDTELVSDFIQRLERTFMKAYGQDGMSLETRETLLHGQLQEGLQFNLMKAPAVSGAQTYPQLCMSAKNEERRQAEIRKRQEYHRPNPSPALRPPRESPNAASTGQPLTRPAPKQQTQRSQDSRCTSAGVQLTWQGSAGSPGRKAVAAVKDKGTRVVRLKPCRP